MTAGSGLGRAACASSYLAFRYLVDPAMAWRPEVQPHFPHAAEAGQIAVATADDVLGALDRLLAPHRGRGNVGLLLSGGIDSAILAALLAPGTRAYTIRFVADGAVDESEQAARYAQAKGLDLRVVDVTWDDHERCAGPLMRAKRAPLHAVEVALYRAAEAARADGIDTLIVGNGADSTFGGLDKLLSRDWTLEAFAERYTFVPPALALVEPVELAAVYARYDRGGGFDTAAFLKEVHGAGITQAFVNAIGTAGARMVEPYEAMTLGVPLDLDRIRRGESKYLLREVFARLYPGLELPDKIPFARPLDRWLAAWSGPRRPELRTDLAVGRLTGDQRWLVYCLERFLDLLDAHPERWDG